MLHFNGQENYFFNTCFQLCWTNDFLVICSDCQAGDCAVQAALIQSLHLEKHR